MAQGQEQEQEQWSIPYFPSASDSQRDGLIRIVNRSASPGTVRIVAFDDAGREYGPLTIEVPGYGAAHLSSDDLELGNEEIGLEGQTGSGQGDWHLVLTSPAEFEALSYLSDSDGFLTSMNDNVPVEDDVHRVWTLNPGRNRDQVGMLRLVNLGSADAQATVRATDDEGTPAGELTISIPATEALTWRAAELESGGTGLGGALGAGVGKWRLAVESTEPIAVMSLQSSPTGRLSNLSRFPQQPADGVHEVPLLPSASDPSGRQGFVRVINRSAEDGEVSVSAFDESTWDYDPLSLSLGANAVRHFNSDDLEQGNTEKGLTGSTGAGQGAWRLTLTSDLDILVLPFVRNPGGLVTAMHDTAAEPAEPVDGSDHSYYLPIFQPANNPGQESRLRLRNPGEHDAEITIAALDEAGLRASGGSVRLNLAAGTWRTLTSQQLEQGTADLCGRFRAGSGKWQLFVSANQSVEMIGLGVDDTGVMENLSRGRAGYFAWPFADPVTDLRAETASTIGVRVLTGGTITLSATVQNSGDAPSRPTVWRCFSSTNDGITPADTEVCRGPVGCLGGDASVDLTASWRAPAQPGTHYIGACVDAVAGETETGNNCSAAVRVTVHVAGIDLEVDAPTTGTGTLTPGEVFTLSTTVRNHGDAGAAATTLRYYRSTDATITRSDEAVGTDSVESLGASGTSAQSIRLSAPSGAGTYYYGACADAVPDESDTGNNCSAAVAVTVIAGTDLVVGTVAASPAELLTEAPFTLSATVRNQGNAGSAATTLRYYRSTDATITTSDEAVGTDAVGSLGASGTSAQSIRLSAPTGAGTYYYGACVDALSGESNTGNNCSAAAAVTVLAGPDLVVGTVAASPDELLTEASFTLSATVRNPGDADSAATTLRYYRSTDATITTSDEVIGTDAVETLGASGTSAQSIRLSAPSQAGVYYYAACVDAVADESDTGNNCSAAAAVTVLAGPDLVVGAASASPDELLTEASFTLSATARNPGDADSAATTLRYYRSTDATITTSDEAVGTDVVESLGASGTSAQSIGLSAPSQAGVHYYAACVDAVADESDTGNNCSAAAAVTVLAGPDLVVESVSANPAEPLTDAPFTLSATVRNPGDAGSAATTLRYYRSTDATITGSDEAIGTDAVGSLGAAGTSAQSIQLTAPSQADIYYYGACVDAVPDESDTGNNCSVAARVPALTSDVDLVVRDMSTTDSAPLPRRSFTLSATVYNLGSAAAPATTLRYRRSTDTTITGADGGAGSDYVRALSASASSDESITLRAPFQAGTYHYGACVDTVPGESDTDNNCSVAKTVTVPEGAELTVDTPWARFTVPLLKGNDFRLFTNVRNAGNAPSLPSTLRYYRSDDATVTQSDTAIGTDALAALSASSHQLAWAETQAPSTAGTYYYKICADAESNELDESNNCSASVGVKVLNGPDMTSSILGGRQYCDGTDKFGIVTRIHNRGDALATNTYADFYQSSDTTITTDDTKVAEFWNGDAGPGVTIEFTQCIQAPPEPGTYYFGVCARAVTNESNTTNNCATNHIELTTLAG